jgi:hypothetical protein
MRQEEEIEEIGEDGVSGDEMITKKKVFCRGCGSGFEPTKHNKILCTECKRPKVVKKKRSHSWVKIGTCNAKKIQKMIKTIKKRLESISSMVES